MKQVKNYLLVCLAAIAVCCLSIDGYAAPRVRLSRVRSACRNAAGAAATRVLGQLDQVNANVGQFQQPQMPPMKEKGKTKQGLYSAEEIRKQLKQPSELVELISKRSKQYKDEQRRWRQFLEQLNNRHVYWTEKDSINKADIKEEIVERYRIPIISSPQDHNAWRNSLIKGCDTIYPKPKMPFYFSEPGLE